MPSAAAAATMASSRPARRSVPSRAGTRPGVARPGSRPGGSPPAAAPAWPRRGSPSAPLWTASRDLQALPHLERPAQVGLGHLACRAPPGARAEASLAARSGVVSASWSSSSSALFTNCCTSRRGSGARFSGSASDVTGRGLRRCARAEALLMEGISFRNWQYAIAGVTLDPAFSDSRLRKETPMQRRHHHPPRPPRRLGRPSTGSPRLDDTRRAQPVTRCWPSSTAEPGRGARAAEGSPVADPFRPYPRGARAARPARGPGDPPEGGMNPAISWEVARARHSAPPPARPAQLAAATAVRHRRH